MSWGRRAVAAMSLVATCGCSSLPIHSDSLTEERAVRALLSEYDASWATHDPGRRLKLFAPDAEITNVVGETVHGIAGLTTLQSSARYQAMYAEAVEKFDSVRVRFITPSVAFVTAPWTMTGAKHPDGTQWQARHGYLSLVIKKANGAWLIEEFSNAEIPPRP